MANRRKSEEKEEVTKKKVAPDVASGAGSVLRVNDLSGRARRGHTDTRARPETEKED